MFTFPPSMLINQRLKKLIPDFDGFVLFELT